MTFIAIELGGWMAKRLYNKDLSDSTSLEVGLLSDMSGQSKNSMDHNVVSILIG